MTTMTMKTFFKNHFICAAISTQCCKDKETERIRWFHFVAISNSAKFHIWPRSLSSPCRIQLLPLHHFLSPWFVQKAKFFAYFLKPGGPVLIGWQRISSRYIWHWFCPYDIWHLILLNSNLNQLFLCLNSQILVDFEQEAKEEDAEESV